MRSIPLFIVGASGQGREVAAAARDAAAVDLSWLHIRGFLDDSAEMHGKNLGALTVLGDTSELSRQASRALLGVGYPETKSRIVSRFATDAVEWKTLIHPRAYVGDSVSISRGCFIQAGCVLTCNITVSEFATINSGVTLNHDVRIGRLATVSPGAHVGGNVSIAEGVFVGIGASVKQGVAIGEWSIIGAGAAVVSDVPANSVVVGVPARVRETRTPGWHLE
jgi:sugar O-acyltransferase (sialic acid O-acetyltransferase NeuD family)